jgi:DNA modification methylase
MADNVMLNPKQGAFCQKCGAWLGTLGLEPTPELYVEHLVLIFREVKRVLADDGTLWLNIGDSRAANRSYQVPDSKWCDVGNSRGMKASSFGMKPKDLVGIPWMVAFALRADGWYLRSPIVWYKNNVKPESTKDRPTSSYEHVFLLTKSAKCYYDNYAVREPSTGQKGAAANFRRKTKDHLLPGQSATEHRLDRKPTKDNGTRNRRDVWSVEDNLVLLQWLSENHPEILDTYLSAQEEQKDVWFINTKGYKGAHFAVFPPALVEPCILAGTSEKGKCPTCGAPWKRIVEKRKKPPGRADDKLYLAQAYRGNAQSKTWGARKDLGGDPEPVVTIGWEPTCTCPPHDPIPDIVLDPFGGAGTTALVASRLGRDCILVDASEVYCVNLAAPRIKNDAPMFNQVSVVNVETEDLTPTENLL